MVFCWEYRNPNIFYFGDSDTYWVLGKAIARGEPYIYDGQAIHRMPGYPVLLAPFFLCFGNDVPILAARLENALIGALTVLVVAWLTFLLFRDQTTALLAGIITAFDPLNIVMGALVLSEAPFCFFMVLQIAFWVKGLRSGDKGGGCVHGTPLVVSGVLYAAAVYCRPSWLYFVPFATIIGIALTPRHFRNILTSGLVITTACVFCLLPWWVRNYQISGHFVSTTLQAGPSLYDGLNPAATGGSDMKFIEEFRNAELKLSPGISDQSLEYKLNRMTRQAAIDWAKKHPRQVWKLVCTKFIRLWNVWPNEPSFSNFAVRIAVFCSYCPVIVLGILGALGTFRQGFCARLLWIPAIYITALHVVFVSSIRYRAPAMICFAVPAAWMICALWTTHRLKILKRHV